jgi:hypothetical protein
MCSTPQKHPAATVALAAPSGVLIAAPPGELRPRLVDVVKGRTRREMNEGMDTAMRTIIVIRMRFRDRGRLMLCVLSLSISR